jgi:hypothetical protein
MISEQEEMVASYGTLESHRRSIESKLWVDAYTPKYYIDLLSPEVSICFLR